MQGKSFVDNETEVNELLRKLTPPAANRSICVEGKRTVLLKSPITKRKEIKRLFDNHNDCESSDILQELIAPVAQMRNDPKPIKSSTSTKESEVTEKMTANEDDDSEIKDYLTFEGSTTGEIGDSQLVSLKS